MKSQAGSNKKLIILGLMGSLTIVALLLLIVSVIVLYYWAVQPIITALSTDTTDIHQGVEYFTSGEYTRYESGKEFEKLLSSTEYFYADCVVDFYHIDSRLRDNPIYGKRCDVFAVDMQLDQTRYTNFFNRDELVSCGVLFDYEVFVLPDYKPESEKTHGFIAICDKSNMVRIVLLTDYVHEQFSGSYSRILWHNSSLNWESKTD